MMRILQLHNRHTEHGGAIEVVNRERRLLENAGHAVETMWVDSADYTARTTISQAVAVGWNLRAKRDVSRLIESFRPDVVHLHTPFPFMSTSVLQATKSAGVPVVMTSHAFRIMCPKGTLERNGSPCELCVGTTLRLGAVRHACYHDSKTMSGVLGMSSALQRMQGAFKDLVSIHLALTPFGAEILARDGVSPDKIRVHPNIVPVDRPPEAARRGMVYVGRLVEEKGIRSLVQAWQVLGADAPPLTIVGDGALRRELEAMAAPNAEFVGQIPSEEVVGIVAGADALIFPSLWREGLGLSWVEAMSVETPVLYADAGNFSALLDGYGAGLKFTAGDSEDLARAVLDFERMNTTERNTLGTNGRHAYEADYSPDAGLQRLLGIYDEAVLQTR